jgi:hypothetical protein
MKNLKKPGDLTKGKKLRLNRGIELILSRRETLKPKTNIILFQFGKMVSFFKREITIYFEFSFDIRKQQVEE